MILPSCLMLLLLTGGFDGNLGDILPAIGQVLAGENSQQGDVKVRMEGSGVVVDPSGLVVTNLHVVKSGSKIFESIFVNLVNPASPYKPPDRAHLYKAEIIAQDVEEDLVILRMVSSVDGEPLEAGVHFKAIPLGTSKDTGFLDEVFALGFPKAGGATLTMSSGKISGKEELDGWLKIDAQVTHGSSGGAVINKKGELIGISTKVRPDIQEIDTNGDGFPDTSVNLGTVGLVRPVEFVAEMLQHLGSSPQQKEGGDVEHAKVEVRGLVQDSNGNSISKVLVGLLKAGSQKATTENLLTWTRADENGVFQFPAAIPPGTYTVRAVVDGYDVYLETLELTIQNSHPILKMVPLHPPAQSP
jgi:S1-C subfamily serine protease